MEVMNFKLAPMMTLEGVLVDADTDKP